MYQSGRPNEKEPLKTPKVLGDDDAFGGNEIRQIQMLMLLLSGLPPNGKVRKALELALALPHDSCLSRMTPLQDASPRGFKTWLETLFTREGLSTAEQKLVDWQTSGENMSTAVQELKEVEQRIGLNPCVQLTPMAASAPKRSVSAEAMQYQAVVDHEFRSALTDTPEAFGMDPSMALLPDAIERQEQESTKVWNEGLAAVDVYDCVSTCSYGPITIVCDGSTK